MANVLRLRKRRKRHVRRQVRGIRTLAQVYFRALGMLQSERGQVLIIVLANIFVASVQLLEPILSGYAVDLMAKGKQALPVIGLWAILGLFNIAAATTLSLVTDRLAHRQKLAALGQAFDQVITLPVSYHSRQGSARIVRVLLSGTNQLLELWLTFLREHLTAIMGIILLIPAAISVDARLAGLLAILAALYLAANTLVIRRTHARQAMVDRYHQNLFGRVGDVIGNITIVQVYNRLTNETSALRGIIADVLTAQNPVLIWWAMLTVFTRTAATISMVAVFAMGAILAGRGEVSVGQVVAFIGFANLLISRLDQLSSFVSRLFNQAPTLAALFNLWDMAAGPAEKPGAVSLNNVRGHVRFDNVTFRFPGTEDGVFNLSFEVMPGEIIALVGPTGSGKSTTLGLLQRLRDPQDGCVLIDGTDIRDVTLTSLRQSIASVLQDTGLFNRSISENIGVGRPSATSDEIESAARLAEAHSFVCGKPGGYQFVIGEKGAALSGGERQRIAIARAILKNAPILILDEATSALDNETEAKIKRALDALRRGRTTFIIAHRLSTVASAHRILVLDRGRIVESGSFQELAKGGGLFERLVQAGSLEFGLREEMRSPRGRLASL